MSGHEPWVTQGYTIENYVPPELLRQAVSEVHPSAECAWKGGQYQDPLGAKQIKRRKAAIDKPAVAERAAARWSEVDIWPLDLSRQVKRLVAFVRESNA